MSGGGPTGRIVILNGAPRSGKSSIVRVMQESFETPWLNLGVDVAVRQVTPPRLRPGIGLRPGGERPDLEAFVGAAYLALYESVAAHSRVGLDVWSTLATMRAIRGRSTRSSVPRILCAACRC